jgi:hypothetical protein
VVTARNSFLGDIRKSIGGTGAKLHSSPSR